MRAGSAVVTSLTMVTAASTTATLPEPRRALPGALGCPLGLSARTPPSASRQASVSLSPARRAADAAPGAAPAPSLGGPGPGHSGPALAGARRQGRAHAYADVSTGGPCSVSRPENVRGGCSGSGASPPWGRWPGTVRPSVRRAFLEPDSLDTEGSALAPQCWHKAPERVSLADL